MIRSRIRTLLLAALVLAAGGFPSRLAAHTALAASAPAAGDTVDGGVGEIRVRFTRPVEGSLTAMALLAGGDTVAAGRGVPVAGSDGKAFTLALPALAPGSYTLAWRTAGADGHIIRGTFVFHVRASSALVVPPVSAPAATTAVVSSETAESDPATSPVAVAVRWAGYVALLGMVGAAAFELGVLRRLRRRREHGVVVARAVYGAWYLAAGAAALSLVTLMVRLWLQSAAVYGPAAALDERMLSLLLENTVWGNAWVLQAIATVAFFFGLLVSRAPHGHSPGWMGSAGAAVILCAVPALSGHAASVEWATGAAILSDALHVLGAGAWLGTLAMLMAAGFPAALSARGTGGTAAFAAMVEAFSPVALVGAGTAGLTGVVNALFHLRVPSELWGTRYGQFLLIKLALLAVVAAIGFHNWRRVRPALGEEAGAQRLHRTARGELVAGALALLVTAILVALPTPE